MTINFAFNMKRALDESWCPAPSVRFSGAATTFLDRRVLELSPGSLDARYYCCK